MAQRVKFGATSELSKTVVRFGNSRSFAVERKDEALQTPSFTQPPPRYQEAIRSAIEHAEQRRAIVNAPTGTTQSSATASSTAAQAVKQSPRKSIRQVPPVPVTASPVTRSSYRFATGVSIVSAVLVLILAGGKFLASGPTDESEVSGALIEEYLKDTSAIEADAELDKVSLFARGSEDNQLIHKPERTSLFPEMRGLLSFSEPAPQPIPPAITEVKGRGAEREIIDTWRNKISFIAGLIAVHRPTLPNSGELSKDIVELSLRGGIDPFYTAAIISVESSFGSGARSHKGATGLMQLMPGTARHVMATKTGRGSDPALTDPRTNIGLGIAYIMQLERQYNGDRKLALAAYNWGPGNVNDAISGKKRIPRAVVDYAKTVLDRAIRWRKQFEGAKHSAATLIDELA